MNKLVKKQNGELVKKQDSAIDPYERVAREGDSTIRGDLIAFKKGVWHRDRQPMSREAESVGRFVVNLDESLRGWQRWFDNKPIESRFGRIIDPTALVTRNELGHLDETTWEKDDGGELKDPWQFCYMLAMKDIAATDADCTFATSSWGGQRAVRMLFGEFGKGRREHPGLYPIVKLGQEARPHKKYGSVLEPRFIIVGWRAWEGDPPALQPDPDDPRTLTEKELEDEIPF